MNDLNTINRLNADADQRAVAAAQASGKFVAVQYSGLHFVGFSAHDTEAGRDQAAAEFDSTVGNHTKNFNPTN